MSVSEQETRQWLRYAQRDLTDAKALFASGSLDNACYLAQQAAEKALKAIYVFMQVQYPFIHNLNTLRDGLPREWSIAPQHVSLKNLTDWATEARYPSELPDATKADATVAVAIAQDVYDSVVASLIAQGYTP